MNVSSIFFLKFILSLSPLGDELFLGNILLKKKMNLKEIAVKLKKKKILKKKKYLVRK